MKMRAIIVTMLVGCMLMSCARTTVVREPSRNGRAKPAVTKPAPKPVPKPRSGASIVVRKGDTLYRIATDNGISPLDLATWNQIPPPYTIHPGQRLRLSPQPPQRSQPPRPVSQSRPTTPANTTTSSGSSRPTVTPPMPPALAVANFSWRWPAEGQIVTRYAANDPTKQGVDIAGRSGSVVRAAADGVVVYSGAGLVGYGELIILKHDEQWLSAYGHNRARLVNEGQRVKVGEQIAEMGRSGASRDMLHFEIRYNGKPQDPLLHLPKR